MLIFERSINSKAYMNNDEVKIIAIFKDDIAHYLKLTVLLHIVGLIPRGLRRGYFVGDGNRNRIFYRGVQKIK